ncbi:MAG TPA: hypothetical protein VFY71_11575 [Planctomycetota bacterium]|nr:hypothetical protein [Planctomycetota bacterium]
MLTPRLGAALLLAALGGCSGPTEVDRGVYLPLVRDTMDCQAQGPTPGLTERLRGLQRITLAGMRNVELPVDAAGTATPVGRGDWDVTHRSSEDNSWWLADRRLLTQDDEGHWVIANEGVLIGADDARAVLLDDNGLFLTARDPARVGQSVLVIAADNRLVVVDLRAWTCFQVH